ncbi:MAG: hypothetical protein GOV01_02105 [Candidatus Altiarchaeota archaeon]|nr:hypothetical protein [Candidatus Altiarchaeota archaeon]
MTEQMSKDEQIGFHKGALTTLIKERQELSRIIDIVNQLIGAHIKSLGELGVKLDEPAEKKEDKVDEKLEDILQSS